MKTKFNGFEVINDRYGMTIHVVAGDIDLFLPIDGDERMRFALVVLDGLEPGELAEAARHIASEKGR